MITKSIDYSSQIVQPFGNDDIDQVEIQEEGYITFKHQSILDSIGTKESNNNIKLFLDEILDELSDSGKRDFAHDCLVKIIDAYGFYSLQEDLENVKISSEFSKSVFELLVFLETGVCSDFLSNTIPYMDKSILDDIEQLKVFLNINYKTFLKNFEDIKIGVPSLFYSYFLYAAKKNAIEVVAKLIQKDVLSINAKQIIKGV